jgi:hypothetical protein
MNDLFNNGIVKGVLATLIAVVILGIFGWLKFRRDEKLVAEFLKKSGIETGDTFTSTHAISSATNLSEDRIRKICSKSTRINRDHKEKESWKLSR